MILVFPSFITHSVFEQNLLCHIFLSHGCLQTELPPKTQPHHNFQHCQPTTFPCRLRHHLATQPPFPWNMVGRPWQTSTVGSLGLPCGIGTSTRCLVCGWATPQFSVISPEKACVTLGTRDAWISWPRHVYSRSTFCLNGLSGTSQGYFPFSFTARWCQVWFSLEDYPMASKLQMDCHFLRPRNTW